MILVSCRAAFAFLSSFCGYCERVWSPVWLLGCRQIFHAMRLPSITWRRESDVCGLYKNLKGTWLQSWPTFNMSLQGCESCLSFAGRVVCRIQCAQRSQLIARRGGSFLAFTSGGLYKKIARVTGHIRELLAVNACNLSKGNQQLRRPSSRIDTGSFSKYLDYSNRCSNRNKDSVLSIQFSEMMETLNTESRGRDPSS